MGRCIIPGCGKPRRGHGYCKNHYYRWEKHGDPHHVDNAWGAAQNFFKDVVLPYKKNKCLIWPFAKNDFGYALMWSDDRMQRVCRLICEDMYGPSKHHSAHSCGKGKQGCVNPMHLSWKTKAENEADKILHGTSNRGRRHVVVKTNHKNVRRRGSSPKNMG